MRERGIPKAATDPLITLRYAPTGFCLLTGHKNEHSLGPLCEALEPLSSAFVIHDQKYRPVFRLAMLRFLMAFSTAWFTTLIGSRCAAIRCERTEERRTRSSTYRTVRALPVRVCPGFRVIRSCSERGEFTSNERGLHQYGFVNGT